MVTTVMVAATFHVCHTHHVVRGRQARNTKRETGTNEGIDEIKRIAGRRAGLQNDDRLG